MIDEKVLIERLEEKIKVTSLEIIVTGTKDKPYFEIKYKEVGKEDYSIGYSSYDLNNVFGWKDECFEIVNQLAEEYNKKYEPTIDLLEYGVEGYNLHLKEQYRKGYEDAKKDNGWIPCSEILPEEKGDYLVTCNDGKVRVWWFVVEGDFKCWLRGVHQLKPIAWKPIAPYQPKGE